MSEGAWVQAAGKVWDEDNQAWADGWGNDLVLLDMDKGIDRLSSGIAKYESSDNQLGGYTMWIYSLVDVTPYSKITAVGHSDYNFTQPGVTIATNLATSNYGHNIKGRKYLPSTSDGTTTLGILSATGTHYVGLSIFTTLKVGYTDWSATKANGYYKLEMTASGGNYVRGYLKSLILEK